MATRKTRIFELNTNKSGFVSKLIGDKKNFNFEDLKILKNLLTNEKGKILYTLKLKQPESIYSLAKLLDRDVKSVRKDVSLLSRFGFIEFSKVKKGKRVSHKPELAVDKMEFILRI